MEILGDTISDNDLLIEDDRHGYTSAIERKDFSRNTGSNRTGNSLPGYDPPRSLSHQ